MSLIALGWEQKSSADRMYSHVYASCWDSIVAVLRIGVHVLLGCEGLEGAFALCGYHSVSHPMVCCALYHLMLPSRTA